MNLNDIKHIQTSILIEVRCYEFLVVRRVIPQNKIHHEYDVKYINIVIEVCIPYGCAGCCIL